MTLSKGVLITGTDTGVGKTLFCLGLMGALQRRGWKICGMKPIASGADEQLQNEDALKLRRQANIHLDYKLVNPCVYRPAIAPHIAAELAQKPVSIPLIKEAFTTIQSQADLIIIEGIGGWRVPLSEEISLHNIALELQLPIIMVVGMRLGCLNHATLTAEAINNDNTNLLGWVANCIDPQFQCLQHNIATLERSIAAPLIAQIPYLREWSISSVIESIKTHSILKEELPFPSFRRD